MKGFFGVQIVLVVCAILCISASPSEDGQLTNIHKRALAFIDKYVTAEIDDASQHEKKYVPEESNDSRWPTVFKRSVLEGTFNANILVDITLQGLRVYMLATGRNSEPIQLPDYHLDTTYYDIYLKEGTLLIDELPDFQRIGDNCTVTVSRESLTFNIKFRIGQTQGMYNKLKAKSWLLRKTYKLYFHVSFVEASMQIVFNFTNLNVLVKDCEITKIGNISLDARGALGHVADWLGEYKVNKDSFKKEIANDMKGEMKKFIQEELDILFPNDHTNIVAKRSDSGISEETNDSADHWPFVL